MFGKFQMASSHTKAPTSLAIEWSCTNRHRQLANQTKRFNQQICLALLSSLGDDVPTAIPLPFLLFRLISRLAGWEMHFSTVAVILLAREEITKRS
eukprot:Skav202769  [mRNA]  locus=scaffold326:261178:261654:- [translate_table: standard]